MLQDVCASANIEVGSVRSSLNLQRKVVSSVDDKGDAVSATLSCSTSALIRHAHCFRSREAVVGHCTLE